MATGTRRRGYGAPAPYKDFPAGKVLDAGRVDLARADERGWGPRAMRSIEWGGPAQGPAQRAWAGEETQGSAPDLRRQAETEGSGLCVDEIDELENNGLYF